MKRIPKRRYITQNCKECGKAFTTRADYKSECCSQSCAKRGARNCNFKDGRSLNFSLKQKLQWEAYPDRMLARQILRTAVRRGKLKRLPCEICAEPKTHGHHTDYSKPLEVRWLCGKHHRELHSHKSV